MTWQVRHEQQQAPRGDSHSSSTDAQLLRRELRAMTTGRALTIASNEVPLHAVTVCFKNVPSSPANS
jgi:hypothetical protein